jgi:hypothetical protein
MQEYPAQDDTIPGISPACVLPCTNPGILAGIRCFVVARCPADALVDDDELIAYRKKGHAPQMCRDGEYSGGTRPCARPPESFDMATIPFADRDT